MAGDARPLIRPREAGKDCDAGNHRTGPSILTRARAGETSPLPWFRFRRGSMTPRHLLALRELPAEEIESLLDEAQAAVGGEVPDLRGAVVATLFYEPSTRTEMSFELAARRVGAEVLRCDVDHSSVRKGESLVDTVRTFAALGADVLVMRHPASGAPALAARHA